MLGEYDFINILEAPDIEKGKLLVDVAYVRDKLEDLAEKRDLSQFIL